MEAVLNSIGVGLPVLLQHLIATIAIFVCAVLIYARVTPHRELELIRNENNVAAAISFSAAIIGLALPLAFCLAGSVNVYDILLWGVVVLCVQITTYVIVDRVMGGIKDSIERQEIAPVMMLASVKLAVAAINAAAIAG